MSFTLYIARSKRNPRQHDVGSVMCLNLLRDIPEEVVTVVDCTEMRRRPSYLKGTPTLIDDESGDSWTGHNAIARLQRTAMFHAQEYGMHIGRTEAANASKPPSTRRPPAAPSSSSAPRVQEESDIPADESLWESRIVEGEEEAEPVDGIGGRKLTADDLSRMMPAQTDGTSQNRLQHPPPPLPPLND